MPKRITAKPHGHIGMGRHALRLLPAILSRVLKIGVFAGFAGAAVILVQQQLVEWLTRPIGEQPFMYTTADQIGFQAVLYAIIGLLVAIPVITYQVLKGFEGRFRRGSTAYFLWLSVLSAVLTAVGVYFGYYYGLPFALQFMAQQFLADPAYPLAAVVSYLHFSSSFLLLSALAAQIPMVMIVANQLYARSVGELLSFERWVIVVGLTVGAILNQSTDVLALIVLALPIIGLYQVGVLAVWVYNRSGRYRGVIVEKMVEIDEAAQAERLDKLEAALLAPEFEPIPVSIPDQGGYLDLPSEQSNAAATESPLMHALYPHGGAPVTHQASTHTQQPGHGHSVMADSGTHPKSIPSSLTKPEAPATASSAPPISHAKHTKPTTVNGIRRRIY